MWQNKEQFHHFELKILEHTVTTPAIRAQPIARRTSTLERSRRVLADAGAQVVSLVYLTLVHVLASAIVAGQLVAIVAGASIRAPNVDASLRT